MYNCERAYARVLRRVCTRNNDGERTTRNERLDKTAAPTVRGMGKHGERKEDAMAAKRQQADRARHLQIPSWATASWRLVTLHALSSRNGR